MPELIPPQTNNNVNFVGLAIGIIFTIFFIYQAYRSLLNIDQVIDNTQTYLILLIPLIALILLRIMWLAFTE